MIAKATREVTAYSYVRFSSPEQAQGDSLRRQTEKAEAYCQRKDWLLDDSLKPDKGVSAFKGRNALVGNLGLFLDKIKSGDVQHGSVLIVESVDRISRQGIDEGYDLIKRILKAGVYIVTLSPEREYGPDAVKGLMKGAMELQMILERAAEESETKSERVGSAWSEKRKCLQQGDKQPPRKQDHRVTKHMTDRLPAWVEIVDGELVRIPERVEIIRNIYAMSVAGLGQIEIVKRLERDKVKPFGRSGKWVRSYVALLLRDRRLLGEFQPMTGRKADGEPIRDYFPAVISEKDFDLARLGAQQRFERGKGRPSRTSTSVNVFAGLLRNAPDGDSYFAQTRIDRGLEQRVLVNTRRAPVVSFNFDTFEKAVLSLLAEIDPREVLPKQGTTPDRVAELKEELRLVEAGVVADLVAGKIGIDNVKRAKDERTADLKRQLEQAERKARHPVKEGWKETKSLLEVLDSDPDARIRLRSCLQRIVKDIWLLIRHKGKSQFAIVEINFTDGGERSLFIARQPVRTSPLGQIPGAWCSISKAFAKVSDDLSDKLQVTELRRYEADPVVQRYFQRWLDEVIPEAEAALSRLVASAVAGERPATVAVVESPLQSWGIIEPRPLD